ncbi:MAG: hypothetical protein AAGC67_04415 [Myxococcota bacterium]
MVSGQLRREVRQRGHVEEDRAGDGAEEMDRLVADRMDVALAHAGVEILDDPLEQRVGSARRVLLGGERFAQHDVRQRRPARDGPRRGAHEGDQLDARRRLPGDRTLDGLREIRREIVAHGFVEPALVAVVVEDRRRHEPDVRGDVLEAGVGEAGRGEAALGGGDDLPSGALGLRNSGGRGAGGHAGAFAVSESILSSESPVNSIA